VVDEFIFWLESIVEDDPLPEEIDVILFKTNFNGKYKYLELLGYQTQINENSLSYRTPEMQFFKSKELAKLNDITFYNRCKYLIEECFSSGILKQQFSGKKIYFHFKNIEFLFKI